MRTSILCVLLACSTVHAAPTKPVAKPATKPTTYPATPAVTAATDAVAKAERGVQAARVAAEARVEATPAYKALAAGVEAKRVALEKARASGTPGERLDAGAAWNAAREAMAKMSAEGTKGDAAIEAAQAAADAAKRELAVVQTKAKQDEATAIAAAGAELHKFDPKGGGTTYSQRIIKLAEGNTNFADVRNRWTEDARLVDDKIRAYLSTHDVPEKIAQGLWAGEPAIGMTRDQLLLMGWLQDVSETENSQVVNLFVLDFNLHRGASDAWKIRITDGKVAGIVRP